jgi:rare lipoprotein A
MMLSKKKPYVYLLLLCALFIGISFQRADAAANPSSLEYEGASVIWKVWDTRVWRFPLASAVDVEVMSDNFNRLHSNGFKLSDLKVDKKDGKWSLCIKDQVLLPALPEHSGHIPLNTHIIALQWMSKIYDAAGDTYARTLTPEYKLKGGYNISTSVSWYGGEKFFGRRCANGERFTESLLSAAAKNLPFGTLVRITTPKNGRSVVVRITDRFREHKNRALDISHAAAELLGIKGVGVAKVNVQVIGRVDAIGGK